MYEFLFESYILKCLNYVWEKKFPYNFTIRVYIVFFVSCQKCVFDNLAWKDLVKNSVVTC